MYKTKQLHYSSFLLAFITLFLCGREALAMIPVETNVDRISAIKTTAISDNTYDNGFKWLIDATIPDNETFVSMKFDNLIYGSYSIPIAKNLRYFSTQAVGAVSNQAGVIVGKVSEYDSGFEIDPLLDLDTTKSGVQIKIEVDVAVPKDTVKGNYSFSYSLRSLDKKAPIITIGDYVKTLTNKNITITAFVNEGTLNETSHTFTENGSFTFEAVDILGNKSSKVVTIDNIDKKLPYLSLKGDNPMIVERYSEFKEPGYRTSDESGFKTYWSDRRSLKMGTVGSYSILYYVEDAAGNVSTITRVVNVVDTTPPVIVINPFNTEPTSLDVEVTASVFGGYLEIEKHTFTQNGKFTFFAKDEFGNSTSTEVEIKNIDKEKPVIHILGDSPIVFEVDSSEVPSLFVRVTDNGPIHEGEYSCDSSGVNYEVVGNYVVKCNAVDRVGNKADEVTREVRVIDTKPPVITLSDYNKDTPTNTDVYVNAYVINGVLNASNHLFTENGSFDFVARDRAGNTATTTVEIKNIDKEKPVIHIEGPNPVVWERGDSGYADYPVRVTDNNEINESYYFTEADNFVANLNTIGDYRIKYDTRDVAGNYADSVYRTIQVRDTKPPVISFVDYIKTPTNKAVEVIAYADNGRMLEGSHVFYQNGSYDFMAIDDGGNISTSTVVIDNIDMEAPVISYNQNTSITLERLSVLVEPILDVHDNITKTPGINKDLGNFDSSKVGTYYVNYTAVDEAGNVSIPLIFEVKVVDTTKPIITVNDYVKVPTNNSIVVYAITSEGVLNFKQHTFNENGSYTFKATDSSNNIGEYKVVISNIDKAKPTISLLGDSVVFERWDVAVDPGFSCSDVYDVNKYSSGIASCDSDIKTINTSTTTDPNQNYYITYKAVDNAGNEIVTTRKYEVADTKPPIITTHLSPDYPVNRAVVVVGYSNEGNITPNSCVLEESGQSCHFVATDEFGHMSEKAVVVTNIDKIKPVINLVGLSTILMYTNEEFKDEGALVSDNMSLNLKAMIDTSDLKINIAGEYYVKYNAVDEAGNNATEVIRKVIIKDNIVPPTNP